MMHLRWSLFLATLALCLLAWPVHGRVPATRPPASGGDKASSLSNKQPPLHFKRVDPDRPPVRHRLAFAPESADRPVVFARADRPKLLIDSATSKPTLSSRDEEAAKQPVTLEQPGADAGGDVWPLHARETDQTVDKPLALAWSDAQESNALEARADGPAREDGLARGTHRPTTLTSSDDEAVAGALLRRGDLARSTAVEHNEPRSKHPKDRPTLGARGQAPGRPTTMYDADPISETGGHPPAISRRGNGKRSVTGDFLPDPDPESAPARAVKGEVPF